MSKRTSKLTKAEMDYRLEKNNNFLAAVASISTAFFRTLKWLILCGFAYLMVKMLAGKNTYAFIDIGISLADILKENKTIGNIIVLSIGIGGLIYGSIERIIRKKTVARLTKRVKELELDIDPGRTSSGITHSGNTRREDK